MGETSVVSVVVVAVEVVVEVATEAVAVQVMAEMESILVSSVKIAKNFLNYMVSVSIVEM